jgi:hypothetical protein
VTRRWLAALPILTVLAALGCADPAPDDQRFVWAQSVSCRTDAAAVPLPGALRDSVTPVQAVLDAEDVRAYVARVTPGGWGGFRYSGESLTLLMVDPSQVSVLLDTLHFYGIQRPADPRNLRVEQVRWDFYHLDEWLRYLRVTFSPAYGFPGVVSPTANRIEVTAQTIHERDALVNRLIELDVPCWLVAVRTREPADPTAP